MCRKSVNGIEGGTMKSRERTRDQPERYELLGGALYLHTLLGRHVPSSGWRSKSSRSAGGGWGVRAGPKGAEKAGVQGALELLAICG
jgi:hypothetical protein